MKRGKKIYRDKNTHHSTLQHTTTRRTSKRERGKHFVGDGK